MGREELGITIGLPFYNAEKYLLDAINSVLMQTHKKFELILIDDGSTDSSLAIAESIQDPRVIVLSDGLNKKLATRLNQIVNISKYDYIARMDADDLIAPTRLEVQLSYLIENDEVDIISTGLYSVTNDLSLVGIRGDNFNSISHEDILFGRKSIVHAALLGRKSWFLRNPYNESLPQSQDTDLWLRSSKVNDFNVMTISEPLYIYREEDNATLEKIERSIKIKIKNFEDNIDEPMVKLLLLSKLHLKLLLTKLVFFIGLKKVILRRRSNPKIEEKHRKAFDDLIIYLKLNSKG